MKLFKRPYLKTKMEILGERCILFHKWETEKDTGFTKYQRCRKCKSKRIIQEKGGYQPIDWNYIKIED